MSFDPIERHARCAPAEGPDRELPVIGLVRTAA